MYSNVVIKPGQSRIAKNNDDSRSNAQDVTSVTSGASQGPHSFNLVFVCVFVCLCHAWRYPISVPSRTVPSNTAGHIQLAAIFKYGFQTQDHNVKQLRRMGMNAKCMGECMCSNSAGSNPR